MGDAIESLYNPPRRPLFTKVFFSAPRGEPRGERAVRSVRLAVGAGHMHIEGMKTRGGFLEKIRAIFGHAAREGS